MLKQNHRKKRILQFEEKTMNLEFKSILELIFAERLTFFMLKKVIAGVQCAPGRGDKQRTEKFIGTFRQLDCICQKVYTLQEERYQENT